MLQLIIDSFRANIKRQDAVLTRIEKHIKDYDTLLSMQGRYTDPQNPLYGMHKLRAQDERMLKHHQRMIALLATELFTGYRTAIPHGAGDHLAIHLQSDIS